MFILTKTTCVLLRQEALITTDCTKVIIKYGVKVTVVALS